MIILKSRQEIEKMKIPNRLVAEVLGEVVKKIKAGISTIELDRLAESLIVKKRGVPAFKGYRGYPNSLCISINEQVVHGIPSSRKLKEGDIVSLDLGIYYDGYYGDAALTVGVGNISQDAERLLDSTRKALYIGIEKAKAGNHLSDISYAIQSYVEGEGFSVVRAFVGHGIGTSLHEDPQVPNFGEAGNGPVLKNGMVIAIEPMVNAGVSDVEVLEDDWTTVTADRSLSAHFEHTVAITDNGAEILTKV
ncbi:MAG: type I methionyl aminopeptidase [Nitrospinae bacterium]|nr:type I methionyl aminopeptidase [Nitrospinota bacterium]MBI3814405.1 type I methionyl aminopeptidase [Nitrospinota bacterium]